MQQYIHMPSLVLCTKERDGTLTSCSTVDPYWISIPSILEIKLADDFLVYDSILKSYQHFIEKEVLEVFKLHLLTNKSLRNKVAYFTSFVDVESTIKLLIHFMCSSGGLDLVRLSETYSSFLMAFHHLNKRTHGINDGKRLIESFTAKDYTTDVLELVETIMTWFDEDRNGKAFIDKFHEIKNKHVSQSRESYKIVQLKKLINEVPDLPSYYDYGKIQEIIQILNPYKYLDA